MPHMDFPNTFHIIASFFLKIPWIWTSTSHILIHFNLMLVDRLRKMFCLFHAINWNLLKVTMNYLRNIISFKKS
jgi:hypothetical protein